MLLQSVKNNKNIQEYIQANHLSDYSIARVIREHRERYNISDGENEYEAEITGNLRFTAKSRADFPAVGDYVAMQTFDDTMAIIHAVLPRTTLLERHAVGSYAEKQIIAANIDTAFIMQAVNNDFSVNRIDRYLTICNSGGINPIVILSKIDLVNKSDVVIANDKIKARHSNLEVLTISNLTSEGLDQLIQIMQPGLTYCILGSSGVGKSTLINNLLDKEALKTKEISQSTNKGKHTTTHRELFLLNNGSYVIDTPGMRELGITESEEGLKSSFELITELSEHCKFSDCTHNNEKGCAVQDAIQQGIIDSDQFINYQKMLREQQHAQATVAEKRKKDKDFGKMVKEVMKTKKVQGKR